MSSKMLMTGFSAKTYPHQMPGAGKKAATLYFLSGCDRAAARRMKQSGLTLQAQRPHRAPLLSWGCPIFHA
jgi:hypothetical protein